MRRAFAANLLLSVFLPAPGHPSDDKKPAHVYTNDDLDRVSRHRAETGIDSVPAYLPGPPDPPPPPSARGEAYWRREASRVRAEVEGLEARAAALGRQIERLRARPATRRGSRAGREETLRARQDELTRRAAALKAALEERARRDGALPGWLR